MLRLIWLIVAWQVLCIGACKLKDNTVAIIIEGLNVSEVPSVLTRVVVPLVFAVTINDLRSMPMVQVLAAEAVRHGHVVALRHDGPELDSFQAASLLKQEFQNLAGVPRVFLLTSRPIRNVIREELEEMGMRLLAFDLDVSADYVTDVPKALRDYFAANRAGCSCALYLNAFGARFSSKLLAAIDAVSRTVPPYAIDQCA